MKKLILSVFFFSPLMLAAQTELRGSKAAELIRGSNEIHFNTRSNAPSFVRFQSDLKPAAAQFSEWAERTYSMTENDALIPLAERVDNLPGRSYTRYQQTYKNVPVEWAVTIAHARDGKVETVTGEYNIALKPANSIVIARDQVVGIIKSILPVKSYKWDRKEEEKSLKIALENPDFTYQPTINLVLLPIGNGAERTFRYAYKVDVYAHEPMGRWDVYIDAETGANLLQVDKICHSNVNGTAVTKYHGTHPIVTDSISPNLYQLKQINRGGSFTTIEALNCRKGSENNAVPFTDADNYWNNVNANLDEAAGDAYFSAQATFDYYKEMHNRVSFDNANGKMLMYLHYDVNYFNAFWNGVYTVFGDGNNQPLTSIDIVGHEWTHAVTQYTADLMYRSEAGALNESFSDIFGTAIEFYSLDSAGSSWIIGKGNFALRNMANPNQFNNPDTYGGTFWTDTKNCVPSQPNDWCGVHNNSGVQNFWFYLLSVGGTGTNDIGNAYSVAGIGIEDAARIAYRNLNMYLTPSSDYNDARAGSIQAAIDLFGFDSPQHIATINAWHAVGVGKPYTFLPIADFSVAESRCAPNSTIQFLNTSGTASQYKWDFGDGQTSTLENPTHLYSAVGSYHVTLIATNVNGSDTLKREKFVNIFTDAPKASACNATVLPPLGTTGIYKVEFANINKESLGAGSEGGYLDFNCDRAQVTAGETYPITITTVNAIPVFCRVFIDYNNDGIYDASELVLKTDNTTRTHTGSITIPADAVKEVPLRMRVVSARLTNNTPDVICSDVRSGQIEDYSVFISSAVGVTVTKNTGRVKIYPNPVKDQLIVENKNNDKVELSIVDMYGKTLITTLLNMSSVIQVADLPSGMYFVKIFSNNELITQKLMKE